MTNEWIEWKGGDCPLKFRETKIEYKMGGSPDTVRPNFGVALNRRWEWIYGGLHTDIIAYRITEDHEPKETKPMTREQILAQIAELEKQLAPMLKCIWVNEYASGSVTYMTEEKAVKNATSSCLRAAVKYQEVIE